MDDLKFDIKIRVFKDSPDFGKGVVTLLDGIEKYGSLKAAYEDIGMSASKAWKLLKFAEKDLGVKLVERQAGGNQGGSSSLTEAGKQLKDRYHLFVKKTEKATERIFEDCFCDLDF